MTRVHDPSGCLLLHPALDNAYRLIVQSIGIEMIEVNSLSKLFGRTVALDSVSLKVNAGEIVGLLGPNGAGKTTMMRVLTGYLPPTSGSALIAGHDVQEDSIAARSKIGYLPETVPVYGELTVRDYLKFTADLHELPPKLVESRMQECMRQTGTAGVSGRLIGHLSKGYRQRVGLVQALLHNPEILILDEPTVGLDPKQVVEIRGLIKELAQHHTVILSSHILPEVSQICSRIVIIDHGRIVATGTQMELEKQLKGNEVLYVELKAPTSEAVEAIGRVPGVETVKPGLAKGANAALTVEAELGRDIREDLFDLAARKHWAIMELRPVSMSLEEVFSRLTTQETPVAPSTEGGTT